MALALPLVYKAVRLDCGYRLDFVVDGRIVVEVKAVDRLAPIHEAQLITYMKLLKVPRGLLLNFNVPRLTKGLRSIALH
jgi:GxxExxY protein